MKDDWYQTFDNKVEVEKQKEQDEKYQLQTFYIWIKEYENITEE